MQVIISENFQNYQVLKVIIFEGQNKITIDLDIVLVSMQLH